MIHSVNQSLHQEHNNIEDVVLHQLVQSVMEMKNQSDKNDKTISDILRIMSWTMQKFEKMRSKLIELHSLTTGEIKQNIETFLKEEDLYD